MSTVSRAEQFFNINVIRFYDDTCTPYSDGDPTQFSVFAFCAVLFVWITCYIAVCKGVKTSSFIVWLTVPLPAILIVALVFKGLTLEGAGDGLY